MIFKSKLKIFFIKFIFIFIFDHQVFASLKQDCKHKAFYVKDILSDAQDQDLTKAKTKAEEKGRYKAFNKLLNRLALRSKIKDTYKVDLNRMISFIQVNKEANSINRFVGSFDFCFNRDEVLIFFKEQNLNFAEVFSLPISIFPIYVGPNGYVFFDKKDLWYSLWSKFLSTKDSLLKFKLSSANLTFTRSLKGREIIKSNKEIIKKIINNDNTHRILIVILEPKLGRDGNYQLKISGKLYNELGEFDQTVFSKIRKFKNFKLATTLNENILMRDLNELIYVFEESWKSNNFFKDNIITNIDIFIPINEINDWSNSLFLLKNIPYIKKIDIIGLKAKVGKIKLSFQGTKNTFFNILNEKGFKLIQAKDDFILIKKS